MTRVCLAAMFMMVCACGDSTGSGGSGAGGSGNEGGSGGESSTGGSDPVDTACVQACEANAACNGDQGDCNAGCAGIGDVTEAAGGTCTDDVLTVFQCAIDAADCPALDDCGLALGFGCIDQYCNDHPEDPACGS